MKRTHSHTTELPWLLALAFAAAAILAPCQELVRNGSFEGYRRCPVPFTDRSIRQLPHVRAAKGTPAHFHACGDVAGAPSNWAGHQAPWDGQGYAGLVLTAHGSGECATREFIQLELAEALVNGGKYLLSFQVSLADHSGYMTDRIGAVFTTKDRSGRRGVRDLVGNPHVDNATDRYIADSAGWMTVEGIYNATGGERFVVIGNFQPCDRTSRKAVISNKGDGVLHNTQRKQAMDLDPDQSRGLRLRLLATQAYVYLDGVSLRTVKAGEGPAFLDREAACTEAARPPDAPELLPDPGFDHNRPTPRAVWKNASGGTPDFFERHSGIYLFSAVNRDHREFIRTDLVEPLDPCGLYAFRMRIKRDASYGHAVDRIGVALVDTFVMDRRRGPLPLQPSWCSPAGLVMDNTDDWLTLCGTIQAPGCSRTLIIGNFDNDDVTTVYSTDPKAGPFAYYLLDDVSLWRSGTVEGCTLTCPDGVTTETPTAEADEDRPGPWPMVLRFAVADHVPGGELRDLAQELRQALAMDPWLRIVIEGHTDTQGAEAANMRLSERRAKAVRDGLVRLGVPRANMHLQAHGSSQPLADNSTPEGRVQNRRVEVQLEPSIP